MGLDTSGAAEQDLDLKINNKPTEEVVEEIKGFDKYNEPLVDGFKKIIERYIGTDFLRVGESHGFKFYQPLDKYQKSMGVTFTGVLEDKVILISAKKPTDEEKEEHFASSISIRFVPLRDWTRSLELADQKGELETGRKIQDPVVMRSPLLDANPTGYSQKFTNSVQELKASLDTKKVHLISFLDNDRRVRADESEYRFKLHKELEKYFPDQKIFDGLTKTMSELVGNNFKGLREDSCRFKLLEADHEVKIQIKRNANQCRVNEITPLEINPSLIPEADESVLWRYTINKNQISHELLEEVTKNVPLPDKILRQKNWSKEYGQRFLLRVAEQIYRANVANYPEQIPAEIVQYIVEQARYAIDQIYSNRDSVAKEYVIQKVVSSFSLDPLPEVDANTTQSSADKKKIEKTKKLQPDELAKKVLGTVRENSEHVRKDLIPKLLSQDADSQTAFWTIHAGEFNKDPFMAQLLSVGSEAELMSYATSKGGDEFYGKNVGNLRQFEVFSGGISHVDPQYLPELQTRLFAKIDSFRDEMSEKDFLEFASQIDLIMYSLHLPFDGSGRAIEDFIYFLSEKYNFPLTFTVLGYREAGSPLMAIKEDVGPMVKQELNKLVLHNLGIESDRVDYRKAKSLIADKFVCSSSPARIAYDSELALITAELIDKLGSKGFNEQLNSMIPSFPKLHELWTQARNLKFFHTPEKYKSELDEITSLISISPNDTTKTEEILGKLSALREKNPEKLSEIVTLLEAFTISKRKTVENAYPQKLFKAVFPDVAEIPM